MALLARLEAVRRGHRRAWVAGGMDLVRGVAVGAGRDARKAKRVHLAVIRVAIRRERGLVAAPALVEDREAAHIGGLRDGVRRMAVGADGYLRIPLGELGPVNRVAVLREDLLVARPARRGDFCPEHRAFQIGLRIADRMRPMTVRAIRGELQTALLERAPVDTVVEERRLVHGRSARARHDREIPVTFQACRRKVEVVRARRKILRRPDVVNAVAVRAPRGLAGLRLPAFGSMKALLVVRDFRRVTSGAVHKSELFGMRKIGRLREVLVAVDAGRAGGSMNGRSEGRFVNGHRRPVRAFDGLVFVASETVVVGGRLRGRGRRLEGGGREQKRGENAPEPHSSILLGRGIAGVRPLLDLVKVRDAVLVAVELLDLGEVVLGVLFRRREILAIGVDVRLALLGHRLHVAGAALRLGGVGIRRAELLLKVRGGERRAGNERDGRGEGDDSEAYLVHVLTLSSLFFATPSGAPLEVDADPIRAEARRRDLIVEVPIDRPLADEPDVGRGVEIDARASAVEPVFVRALVRETRPEAIDRDLVELETQARLPHLAVFRVHGVEHREVLWGADRNRVVGLQLAVGAVEPEHLDRCQRQVAGVLARAALGVDAEGVVLLVDPQPGRADREPWEAFPGGTHALAIAGEVIGAKNRLVCVVPRGLCGREEGARPEGESALDAIDVAREVSALAAGDENLGRILCDGEVLLDPRVSGADAEGPDRLRGDLNVVHVLDAVDGGLGVEDGLDVREREAGVAGRPREQAAHDVLAVPGRVAANEAARHVDAVENVPLDAPANAPHRVLDA